MVNIIYMKKFLLILFFFISLKSYNQNNYPPKKVSDAVEHIYKNTEDTDLKIWVFNPKGHKISNKKPGIVFFFGGGYRTGTPDQFVEHAKYLSARGMVAIIVDYRVSSRHNVNVINSISDGKSSIRWIKENSDNLGIDKNKIIASGGSAGGHLAASTALLNDYDDQSEINSPYDSKPNALILFNPGLNTKSEPWINNEQAQKRIGTKDYYSVSPYHNIKKGVVPTIIFHGTSDKTVPFLSADLFTKRMIEFGNSCILYAYKNKEHGFFNFGRDSNGPFVDTMNKVDDFLVSLRYLEPLPELTVK